MKIERSFRNEISAAAVYEMSVTKQFQENKCRDAGALSWDVSVGTGADGAVVVRTERKLPTVGFPALLRKIVPAGVTSIETVTWGGAAADGSRTAALHVDFHGSPANMTGTIRVIADGDTAAVVLVDAQFKAHLPIIGGRVEGFVAPIILSVIDAEEATAKAWAAGER